MAFKKIHNNKTRYYFFVKNKNTEIYLTRIINFTDYKNNLIKIKEFPPNFGYFIFNPKGFNSFLINEKLDIIFTDWDNHIFHLEKNFKTNSFTKGFKNAKFLYILPQKTIDNFNINLNDIITHRRMSNKKWRKIEFRKISY
ncbi:hypothetical protein X271_00458 [Candidatus Hepatoplasma crinochetorum Av]|uniref:Uncharacterized protein n=1 Tax=Candidatus Hepatoplasma crinochetorum Av TaxID=1427984 RepID=W8GG53_9MOLU|nr:hypothetical protein [Candidatus Hepatoplasma crinochetorum]AHK22563.1 hypothetical protein X271_00458 [Candidatus Hepatoplasma crinochetorum Av]